MVLARIKNRLERKRLEPHEREDRIARTEAPGAAPGTLTVEPDSRPPAVTVIAYDEDALVESSLHDFSELSEMLERWPVTWINIDGLGDTELIRKIGERFGIHKLTLEDIVHVDQRAKAELFPDYLFVVTRMVYLEETLATEQLSLIVGDRFVLSFQEGHPGDCLDPVRRRLRDSVGRIRGEGPGFLTYALIDAVVDHYFPVLERYGERLDAVESEVLSSSGHDIVSRVHELKRDLLTLKRTILPQREGIAQLSRHLSLRMTDDTRVYLRDVSDHTVQLIEMLETYREMAGSLIDMHVSLAGHRMNEVMKVLTVIGSIFMPLTFITGLYGMNFDHQISPWNMPELHTRYGYPLTLAAMLAVTIGLVVFFVRRGWIFPRSRPRSRH